MRNSALEKVAVKKVKHEVDAIIDIARTKLEEYVENDSDESLLAEVSTSLVQVERTLQLVQINGAAVLAREMTEVVDGLTNDLIKQKDKALECLSRGILQMSDYLEYVQAGNKDLPVVLLPLLNDLRGVREAPLLSEHILFFPDLDDIDVPVVNVELGMSGQEYAKKIRYGFQTGLVGVIQNKEIDVAATKMCKVAIRLHQCAQENASRRLWWVSSAIAQALAIEALATSTGLASLLGQVDRQIKRFIELDEKQFAEEIPPSLIKNLLYYVGIAKERGRIVTKVKQTYGLDELIPNEMDIDKMREGMSGPSADVLEAVSKALHEDIETVKDSIEIYVHSKNRSPESVIQVSEELQKIADTLSMLGLDEPREDVLREVKALKGLSAEELEHADSNFIAVAETLIKAENIVANFVNYRVINTPVIQAVDSKGEEIDSPSNANQLRQVQVQTITEALTEIEEAKNAVSQVLTTPEDNDNYISVQDHFRKVIGALSILNLDDAVKILESIQAFLLDENAAEELSSQPEKLDAFADSITSVECYLEALVVDEGDPKDILEYGVKNAAKLVGVELEISEQAEPLQTVELEELAEDDRGSLESIVELKKKPKITDLDDLNSNSSDNISADLSNDIQQTSSAEQNSLDEHDLESLSATTIDLSLDFDLLDAEEQSMQDSQKPSTKQNEVEEEAATELLELPDVDEEVMDLTPELAILKSTSIEEAADELNSMVEEKPSHDLSVNLDEDQSIGVVEVDEDAENLLDLNDIEEKLNSHAEAIELPDFESSDTEVSDLEKDTSKDSTNESATDATEVLLPDLLPDANDDELLVDEIDSEPEPEPELDLEPEPEPEPYSITVKNNDDIEQRLLANNGEIDQEVLEIFIEEAEEEVEKINLNRVIWRDDEANDDSLSILRRSFHTLKGGGRMVGAEILGEYSWQLENILNKVIDKSVDVSSDLHELIEMSVALLNELVLQLKTNNEPKSDVAGLYTTAQNYLVRDADAVNVDVKDSDDELNDSVSPIDTNIEVINLDIDELEDIAQLDSSNALQIEEQQDAPEEELEDELYVLFLEEAKQHVATIEQIVEPKKPNKILPIDDSLLHALHTLFGCSRTAQVDSVAKLIGPLDKYCQQCNQAGQKLKADEFDVFAECIEHVKHNLHENSVELRNADVNENLLQKINELKLDEIPVLEDVVEPEGELEKTQRITMSDTNISENEVHGQVDLYEGKDADLVDIFLEEASDILEVCNQCLEKWRANHKDEQAVSEFQRQMHTLKGSARMATYSNIGDFSHKFETFVIDIAESRIETNDSVFSFAQRCLDHINEMVDLAVAREPVLPASRLIAELEALRSGKEYSPEDEQEHESEPEHALETKPDEAATIDQKEQDEVELEAEVELKQESNIPEVIKQDVDKTKKRNKVKIPVLRNLVGKETQQAAQPLISGQQAVRLQSGMLDNLVNSAGEVNIFQARLEQVANNYNINIFELEHVVDRLREQLRNLEIETETQILSRHAHEVPEQDDFDPLELDRYSNIQQLSRSLAESVNDLLSIKDILSDQVRESELLLSQQRRISGDLQEGLMRTRMVQFSQLVPRLQRIVRQTSRELDKQADLVVSGQNTEVDSSILNRIVAPLEHLVRNAISHGIEEQEQRNKANKNDQGEIKITVAREGAEIVIVVADDGAGLDVEKLKSKALEMGLIGGSDISEREALNLILTPGFSTAGQVSQVSGRGVGMDVVASELKQLGGSLQIDSVLGEGAKFVIRIPFTLAITQSLLVKCANEIYAVPLASVEGVVRLSAHELKQKYAENASSYHYADRDYRLCHLGSLLNEGQPQLGGADKMFPVLLVRSGDSRMAIHVEATLGNREIVVKPLASQLSRLPAVSGATILGDGNVVLILDIQGLVRINEEGRTEDNTPSTDHIDSDAQPTVMVVDDSITIRKVTTRFLERNNYNVVTAKDGVDAVQKLQDFTPELILLDIEMPRMDGFELATHIRNNERLKSVPIIMITSRTGDKHRQRAMDIGVQEYLGKPYNESELLGHVKSVVN